MLDAIRESLAIDFRVLLLNAAAFLLLLLVLDRIFWKPILRHLGRREASIEAAYDAIEAARADMERLRAEYQAKLDEVEFQARARIQETLKAAQKTRDEALAQARAEAASIAEEGARQIEADRDAALRAAEARLERAALEALARAQGAPADASQVQLVREFIRSRAERN